MVGDGRATEAVGPALFAGTNLVMGGVGTGGGVWVMSTSRVT